jgi:hypothetical protein
MPPHWQTAAGQLILAAEFDGSIIRAEIAVLRALIRDRPILSDEAEEGQEE